MARGLQVRSCGGAEGEDIAHCKEKKKKKKRTLKPIGERNRLVSGFLIDREGKAMVWRGARGLQGSKPQEKQQQDLLFPLHHRFTYRSASTLDAMTIATVETVAFLPASWFVIAKVGLQTRE